MRKTAPLLALVGILLSGHPLTAVAKETYKVIVNAANPESAVKREQLSGLFLKNTIKWSNGTPVSPVDQSVTSPVRIAFSKDVFGQPVAAIQSYWQKQSAAGQEGPPAVRASDREVLAYVLANVGAVGYVSPDILLSKGVKVLKVTE
jgi:ABC-type phosphate transport system substrate-binding protein